MFDSYLSSRKGFTSADGNISVLLQGLVGAVNWLSSKDNTLDVESSRGNDNTHKAFDLVEVLTHSNIHIIV